MIKMVDQAALETAMTLQKGYIDQGDQANATRIQQLESTTEEQGNDIESLKESVGILESTTEQQGNDIESLKESVGILETGSPFYVAAYARGTNDSVPLLSQGNPEICKKFDFFLLDTSDNAGEYTTPVGKLMKNNLLRFADGLSGQHRRYISRLSRPPRHSALLSLGGHPRSLAETARPDDRAGQSRPHTLRVSRHLG